MAATSTPPFTSKNILFFGATGTIGLPILKVILENKSLFDRLVVFTSPGGSDAKKSLLEDWKASGVQIIEGDLASEEQVLAAYEGRIGYPSVEGISP
jgi:1-deoxy-D-xylulose 5-phosphate reductoisomerase